jgi:hypothetical protein
MLGGWATDSNPVLLSSPFTSLAGCFFITRIASLIVYPSYLKLMWWLFLTSVTNLSLISRILMNGGRCSRHLKIQLVKVKVGSNEALIYIYILNLILILCLHFIQSLTIIIFSYMSSLKGQSNITQFNLPCAFKLTGRPVYLAVWLFVLLALAFPAGDLDWGLLERWLVADWLGLFWVISTSPSLLPLEVSFSLLLLVPLYAGWLLGYVY